MVRDRLKRAEGKSDEGGIGEMGGNRGGLGAGVGRGGIKWEGSKSRR